MAEHDKEPADRDADPTAPQAEAADTSTTDVHEPVLPSTDPERADGSSREDALASLQESVPGDDSAAAIGGPALVPTAARTPNGDVASWATGKPTEQQQGVVPPVIDADT